MTEGRSGGRSGATFGRGMSAAAQVEPPHRPTHGKVDKRRRTFAYRQMTFDLPIAARLSLA